MKGHDNLRPLKPWGVREPIGTHYWLFVGKLSAVLKGSEMQKTFGCFAKGKFKVGTVWVKEDS